MPTNGNDQEPVDFDRIRVAATRIAPYIHRTPLLVKSSVSEVSGFERLFFKLDIMQRTSSWKFRSAANAVVQLVEQAEKDRSGHHDSLHLVTHSSGNFGQAVARAATMVKSNSVHPHAHIVIPKQTPRQKVAGIRRLGATIVPCDEPQQREATARSLLKSISGSVYVSQYDSSAVINGAGTLGLELMEQYAGANGNKNKSSNSSSNNYPDIVIVPLGGAALLAGVATAIKAISPSTLVVGAEPDFCATAAACFEAQKLKKGLVTENKKKNTATDDDGATTANMAGLITHLNERTFSLILPNVDAIITVSKKEIVAAMMLIMNRLKLVIEPAAAVAAAVALYHRGNLAQRFPDRHLKTACCVLSEGNIDVGNMMQMSKI